MPHILMLSAIINKFYNNLWLHLTLIEPMLPRGFQLKTVIQEAINPLSSVQRCRCFGLTFIIIYQLVFFFLLLIFLMFSWSIESYTLRLTDSELACSLTPSSETSLVELITGIYNTFWTLGMSDKSI